MARPEKVFPATRNFLGNLLNISLTDLKDTAKAKNSGRTHH